MLGLKYNFEKKLTQWINKIIKNNIPKNIKAINFGLLESPQGYSIYFIGSKKYDKNNDDWACIEDFTPKNKYLFINNKSINNKDWKSFQALVKSNLENIFKIPKYKDSFSTIEYLTTGFDEGNLTQIKY